MAVTNTPKTTLDTILKLIHKKLPELSIIASDGLCWSPKNNTITYRAEDTSEENVWGLLHESGHAVLGHTTYHSDAELLLMEVAAWDTALDLAQECGLSINNDHVQDCLDTYRDWLHQRSTCPRCGIVTFQENTTTYRCFNCRKLWTVSASRLCRAYRLTVTKSKDRPEHSPQAVFQSKRTQ